MRTVGRKRSSTTGLPDICVSDVMMKGIIFILPSRFSLPHGVCSSIPRRLDASTVLLEVGLARPPTYRMHRLGEYAATLSLQGLQLLDGHVQ